MRERSAVRTAIPSALAITGLLLLLAACGDVNQLDGTERGGGLEYRQAFAKLIRDADSIIATEHSSELDLYDFEASKSEIPEQIVYATRELSEAQRKFFLETIESLDPKTQDEFAACVPIVHHTFKFYQHDELVDTVDVCFQCGQVEWSGTEATPPSALYTGLAAVVEHIGLSPTRDWPLLARQHVGGGSNSSSNR